MRRFVRFHGRRHPRELGALEVKAFLDWLATDRNASASTHTQALCALLFLYRKVLDLDVPWLDDLARPKRTPRLPTVLTREEVRSVLSQMQGVPRLMASLLYGSGLRLLECARLRVKDIDFDPSALDRKYPNAARSWPWQWVFPATRTYRHPETGLRRRHHLHETVLQRAFRAAVLAARICKHASCHSLRHSFATHLLETGYDIRTIQELKALNPTGAVAT